MRFSKDSPNTKGSPKAFAGDKRNEISNKEKMKKVISKRLTSVL